MDQTINLALVDDHPLLRKGIASLVTSFDGYQVLLEADNGQEFVDQVRQQGKTPDIVLLDITMPIMNGYETAQWIKENLPDTKVLVLSMMENDTAIIRMLKHGARGYILKDSKPHVFKEALNQVRDHGYYFNEIVSSRLIHLIHNDKDPKLNNGASAALLSEKEIRFIKLCCTELTYREIADELGVAYRTVDTYREELFRKLELKSRVGLVIFAIKNGIFIVR